MINWIALFCSSAGFAGFIPGLLSGGRVRWGGVMGALVGVALQIFCMRQADAFVCQLALVGITLFVGMNTIPAAELFMFMRWGSRRRHTGDVVDHDFNETCIDEVHGQLIAGLPIYWLAGGTAHMVLLVALSFGLFRFFDVVKMGPVKWAEEGLPGAAGIMLDDTVAGLMAAAVLVCLVLFA